MSAFSPLLFTNKKPLKKWLKWKVTSHSKISLPSTFLLVLLFYLFIFWCLGGGVFIQFNFWYPSPILQLMAWQLISRPVSCNNCGHRPRLENTISHIPIKNGPSNLLAIDQIFDWPEKKKIGTYRSIAWLFLGPGHKSFSIHQTNTYLLVGRLGTSHQETCIWILMSQNDKLVQQFKGLYGLYTEISLWLIHWMISIAF